MANYSEDTTHRFLDLYRKLERVRANEQEAYRYYQKQYYEKFEMFREIRNYLSHEEYGGTYPFAVSDLLCDDLEKILNLIGTSAYEVAIKNLIHASPETDLLEALDLIGTKSISYLPLLNEKKKIVGVISEMGALKLLQKEGKETLKGKKVGDMGSYFSLKTLDKRVIFLAKDAPFHKVVTAFQTLLDGKRLGLIFITEHGKDEEAVIGMISIYDMVKNLQALSN